MTRSLLLACTFIVAAAIGHAQDTKALVALVEKFPAPAEKDGKLFDVDKTATDAAIAELLKNPETSVVGLIELMPSKEHGSKAVHALHALVMRVGDPKLADARKATAKGLATTLGGDRPKEIQGFAVRQLQLIGDESQIAAIAKLLTDEELIETAAPALLAIKGDVAGAFRNALDKAPEKKRVVIVQALGTLKDRQSVEPLRTLLDNTDAPTRLTAAWALSVIPDADSADRLLKMADAAKGYERASLTDSCFRLAESLKSAGNADAARAIYVRLEQSRTEPSDRFVKDAAAKGLKDLSK